MLDHLFESLSPEIDEAIIIVRHLAQKFKDHCGEVFHGRPITYVDGPPGTAPSFLATRPFVKPGRFLIANGDDLPSKADIVNCLRYPASVACWEMDDPWNHGVLKLHDDGTVAEIIEKPKNPSGKLILGGLIVADDRLFSYEPEAGPSVEKYLTSMITQYVKDVPTMAVRAEWGIGGVSRPEDLDRVTRWFAERNISL